MHAAEFAFDGAGQGFGESGFAGSGDVFKQSVAGGEEGNEEQADAVGLSADDFGEIGLQAFDPGGEEGEVVVELVHGWFRLWKF